MCLSPISDLMQRLKGYLCPIYYSLLQCYKSHWLILDHLRLQIRMTCNALCSERQFDIFCSPKIYPLPSCPFTLLYDYNLTLWYRFQDFRAGNIYWSKVTKPILLLVKQHSALFLLERRIDRRLRLEKGRAWSIVIHTAPKGSILEKIYK